MINTNAESVSQILHGNSPNSRNLPANSRHIFLNKQFFTRYAGMRVFFTYIFNNPYFRLGPSFPPSWTSSTAWSQPRGPSSEGSSGEEERRRVHRRRGQGGYSGFRSRRRRPSDDRQRVATVSVVWMCFLPNTGVPKHVIAKKEPRYLQLAGFFKQEQTLFKDLWHW